MNKPIDPKGPFSRKEMQRISAFAFVCGMYAAFFVGVFIDWLVR